MKHLFVIVSREAILSVHSLGHRLKTTLHFCIELISFDSVLTELLHHVLLPPFVQLRFKCVKLHLELIDLFIKLSGEALRNLAAHLCHIDIKFPLVFNPQLDLILALLLQFVHHLL